MRIRHLNLSGVRAIDGLSQDLPRTKDTDLVVVYGGYAKGKTTFLDAIAAAKELVAQYGPPDGRWATLPGPRSEAANVTLSWEASDEERARLALSDGLLVSESILGRARGQAEHAPVLAGLLADPGTAERGSIHYLHDGRELGGPLSYGAEDASVRQRLTTRNSKFADLYDLLDQPERAAAKALASARLAELAPSLEIVGLRRTGTNFRAYVRDRRSDTERPVDELSASERQAFLVACYCSKAPIVDSVIMLDAPELGFGDDGATDLVRALLRWTTRTQLVVATASRAVRALPEVAHVVELPT